MSDPENVKRIIDITYETRNSVLKRSLLESLEPVPFEQLDPSVYSSWYLHSCYPEMLFHDEKLILDFLVREAPRVQGAETLIELGCGPVVSHIIPFVPYIQSFILSDYLEENLNLIGKWTSRLPEAHDWSIHTSYVLRKEGHTPTVSLIEERESTLRSKIRTLVVGDLLSKKPIRRSASFPVVACFYATEQAASDESEWLEVVQNLGSLVAPGGQVFLTCLRDTPFYAIHDHSHNAVRIPIVPVTERLMIRGLQKAGFSLKDSTVESVSVSGLKEEGIEGVILARARKPE